MPSTTIALDPDVDPRTVGSNGWFWHEPSITLAGFGAPVRIPLDRDAGAAGGAAAQRALVALVGDGAAPSALPGPVAFASLPFDPAAPGELVVPEVQIGRRADGQQWLAIVGDRSVDEALALIDACSRREGVVEPSRHDIESTVPPGRWRDEIVAGIRDRIRGGELTKAVLARELVIRTDQPIDIPAVVRRLQATQASAMVFSIDGFVGASPELLVARDGDVVQAHPLAGTAARGSDPEADRRSAVDLMASTKDRWEHQITIDWLLDELLRFVSYVDAEPEPTIVTLPNVHHLGTRVEGRLSNPPASVLELVAALHPTPAVGGDPQADALAVIEAIEGRRRGRYAGPVGWLDAAGNGRFAVGIRSAEIDGTQARAFAGVGVVADSDPEAELAETRAKFGAIVDAIVRF